jgi:hypothetical protein
VIKRSAHNALLLLAISFPSIARADGRDDPIALGLFDDGTKKMNEGKCLVEPVPDSRACEAARLLLRRAFDVNPTYLGALRNAAHIERTMHLWASAARNLREIVRRAPDDPKRKGWVELAKAELAEVDPMIGRISIQPVAPTRTVLLDGRAIPAAALGVPLEVDPGSHSVRVEEQNCSPGEAVLDINDNSTRIVKVDAECKTAQAQSTEPDVLEEAAPPPSRGGPIALVVGGGAITAAGLVFGGLALSARDRDCPGGNCRDDALGKARTWATFSTVGTIAGVVMAAGGIWWFFHQGSESSSSRTATRAIVLPSPRPGGLTVDASFTF